MGSPDVRRRTRLTVAQQAVMTRIYLEGFTLADTADGLRLVRGSESTPAPRAAVNGLVARRVLRRRDDGIYETDPSE